MLIVNEPSLLSSAYCSSGWPPSSSPVTPSLAPNGASVHHGKPSSAVCSRTAAIGWKADPPRSIGASPPAAALAQDASRNSWLVETSSLALVLIRSGSQDSTRPPIGS